MQADIRQIEVIAPNLKRRLSGVTATIARLVPVQAGMIGIAATGPGLPDNVPHVPPWRCAVMPRDRWRVWHARRNTEMLAGLALTHVFRRRLKLLFTSASQRRHSRYTRWLISRMDGLVATSRKTASYLERPAAVILHGIDTTAFSPPKDRQELRRQLGLPVEQFLVGCFGRIREQKGTGDFVAAAIAVLSRQADATAIVMGRATGAHRRYLADLRSRVAASGLSDRILFLPEVPVDAVADWYGALDLFVAPQRWEGFGLTPVEAMACGVPVIATRVGAFDEIVKDSETGLLTDAGDVTALAAAINRLLGDAALRARMSTASRARAETAFRIEDEAAALVNVYRGLLS
jgi:mannosyltransferase